MRTRLFSAAALALIATLLLLSVASADRTDQTSDGHDLPEVPIMLALPVIALGVGGGYYLVRRRSRSSTRSLSRTNTEREPVVSR